MENNTKDTNPFVSIILPVYNGETYLEEAICSILHQDYSNLELLIIDDGSTDRSAEISKKFQLEDSRVTYVRNDKNMGLIGTLNKAIAMAKGELIGRIDADDIWSSKDKLSKQVEYLASHHETVIVGTFAKAINIYGNDIYELRCPISDLQIRNNILIKNPFIHPSVVFRRKEAIQAGLFKTNEKHVEDYGLWMRLGEFGKFANIPDTLMKYRVHPASVTQSNNLQQTKNSLNLAKEHRNQYPNFFRGYMKWVTKLALVRLFGIANINTVKKLLGR